MEILGIRGSNVVITFERACRDSFVGLLRTFSSACWDVERLRSMSRVPVWTEASPISCQTRQVSSKRLEWSSLSGTALNKELSLLIGASRRAEDPAVRHGAAYASSPAGSTIFSSTRWFDSHKADRHSRDRPIFRQWVACSEGD